MKLRYALAGALTATTAAVAFACSDPQASIGATLEGGIPDVVLASGAWGATECATCTFDACREERAACRAEPGCARNLDCIEACPSRPDKDPDPGCVQACPPAPSSAAEVSRLELERCRTTGGATACVSCPATHQRRFQNPLLHQGCETLDYDAGAGAMPPVGPCATCSALKCCAQRIACNNDPQCSALADCQVACNNEQTCFDACNVKFESVAALRLSRAVCTLVLCPDECASQPDRCSVCLYDDCADATVACQSDHDCYWLGQCAGKCMSESCQVACRDKYPGGISLYSAQLLCVQHRCPTCF